MRREWALFEVDFDPFFEFGDERDIPAASGPKMFSGWLSRHRPGNFDVDDLARLAGHFKWLSVTASVPFMINAVGGSKSNVVAQGAVPCVPVDFPSDG
jgi:hypothetical protein